MVGYRHSKLQLEIRPQRRQDHVIDDPPDCKRKWHPSPLFLIHTFPSALAYMRFATSLSTLGSPTGFAMNVDEH